MAVTMDDIKKLRTMTGAGMMDCKKALAEADGDIEKAMEIVRKKGQAIAAKRSDRDAAEGCILADCDGTYAATIALKCETDFVAKNADFIALTQKILDNAFKNKPADLATLNASVIDGSTIDQLVTDRSGVTGEKMELDMYCYVSGASAVAYIHPGNKLAAIVAFNQPNVDATVAKDIAMQIAAMNPVAIDETGVAADILEREKEIAKEKAREAGKPENLLDRIAEGAVKKYFKEFTLLEQEFIKDAKINVAQYLDKASKGLTVTAFKRITLNQE
ncbi:MAG TPA: translation elongation factor Ts [Paludibacteraceae bacterium]|nr:translation elongation factor Ts [Paludibacteraceae bacterium]HOU68392.1 translation elongation factor Ts [Paludibacteraceae bacterium]HPH62198.1 translation elongation factor Ts [Paludibacteraceae bacterium]HQF50270.1 translation elongation factor Ts [Paludibacteraceae bacterium]